MDISVQREALLKPLQAVSGVVEKKQTLAILSNVLLTVKENEKEESRLWLTGTDLEIELMGSVPIEELLAPGQTTVSARKLFDICRALPEMALVRLTLVGNYLEVKAGESSFKLNTLPAADFPSIESIEYANRFTIKQQVLKNLLAKTYFAMGQQDVRHYLNGALLDIRHQQIKSIAADGHRLALATIEDDTLDKTLEAYVIIPRKSVLELIRLLGNESDLNAEIHLGHNGIQVVTSEFVFITKLIVAQYPDYNRLIPQGYVTAMGDAENIKQALTRAAILSNEKFRIVRFQLETNKLCITANNSDQELAEEALPITYTGTPMEIGFNVSYLLDAVLSIINLTKSKAIRFILTDANSGVRIEPVEAIDCQYVVMPMRL